MSALVETFGTGLTAVTVIHCCRHVIRPSAVESVSDVITPNNTAVVEHPRVEIHTLGGQHHVETFETVELAEAWRTAVLNAMFPQT